MKGLGMRQHLSHTTLLKSIILIGGLVTGLLLSGCSDNAVQSESGLMNSGAAEVEIKVGKIGVLAKRSMIEMNKLIVEIVNANTSVTVLKDTTTLVGHAETQVNKRFDGLKAPDLYILQAKAVDKSGKTIHSGSKIFSTIPAGVVNVNLGLAAQYSMLKVSYNNVPDSVGKVTLAIISADTIDSSFVRGVRDTVVLAYDYLPADSDGISYPVSLKASGSFFGKDTVLYAADTTISAVSGVDKSYLITLKWVGPGYPSGAAAITVTIGAVGTTVLNAGFTQAGGLSDLVDDLEDGDHMTRYNTTWFTYNDSADGGKSTVIPTPWVISNIEFRPVTGGALNSAYSASFSFVLNKGTNINPPFAGMGFDLDTAGLNISTATGISFYYKGSRARVLIRSKTITDFAYWGCTIDASADWKLVTLTWSQFSQPSWGARMPFDRTAVRSINFEWIGVTGDAGTVWVDDIHLLGYLR
jgi:hypothetical protein